MRLLLAALAAWLGVAPMASAGVLYSFETKLFLGPNLGSEVTPPIMTLEFAPEAVAAGGVTGYFLSCDYGPIQGLAFGRSYPLCPDPDPMQENVDESGLFLDVTFLGDTMLGALSFASLDLATLMVSLDGALPPLDDVWVGLVSSEVCPFEPCAYAGQWVRQDLAPRPATEAAPWLLLLAPLVWLGASSLRSSRPRSR